MPNIDPRLNTVVSLVGRKVNKDGICTEPIDTARLLYLGEQRLYVVGFYEIGRYICNPRTYVLLLSLNPPTNPLGQLPDCNYTLLEQGPIEEDLKNLPINQRNKREMDLLEVCQQTSSYVSFRRTDKEEYALI